MLEEKKDVGNSRRRAFVLFSAMSILLIAFSVLMYQFPPGMETGAALLLITPFAMCILVAETSYMAGQYVMNKE